MKRIFATVGLTAVLLLAGCQQDRIVLTTDSEVAREYLDKGLELALRLRNQEAVEYFRMALKHDPEFAMANYFMAVYAGTPGDRVHYFNEAKDALDRISWGEQQYILALEAGISGYGMKQREIIAGLCERYPQDQGAKNLLGNLYFSQQEYEKAIAAYNEVIRIDPEYSLAYNQLGYCYRFLGDYTRAEQSFKKYIELIPDDPNPYDSYAELLLKMGEYEISIENYEKALKINPDFMNSYMGLASNYNIKREYKTARKYLKEFYLRSKSEDQKRTALTALIISCIDEGDLDGAMKWGARRYEESVATTDTIMIAADLNMTAYLHRLKDQPDAAMAKYREAQELVDKADLPQSIKNNFRRGVPYAEAQIALMTGDLALAEKKQLEFMQEIEQLENPVQMRLTHELAGQIALAKGAYELAIEEFGQANQQNAHNLYRTARAYEGLGMLEKALDYYERAANFNAFMDIDYALIRTDAEKKAAEVRAKLKNL